MTGLYLKSSFVYGWLCIRDSQKHRCCPSNPLDKFCARPIQGFRTGIVVQVNRKALHLSVLGSNKNVRPFQDTFRPLLSLNVWPPTAQDSRKYRFRVSLLHNNILISHQIYNSIVKLNNKL